MKTAISTYSLYRWRNENRKSLEASIDVIAGLGVDGVEFAGLDQLTGDASPRRALVLRKHVEKRKLEIAGYCTVGELLVPPDKQREAVDRLKREVEVARSLGATRMRHDITRGFGAWSEGVRGAKSFATVLKTVVPAIREVADYARERGVRTSLENHGFYMQPPARVQRLLRAVNHPNFRLTLDMGNFLCVQADPVAAVRKLLGYAQTVHIKDFHVRPKHSMPPQGWFATPGKTALRGAILGHGVIDLRKQLQLLREGRYRGFLSIEFEGMEDPLLALQLGVKFVRES